MSGKSKQSAENVSAQLPSNNAPVNQSVLPCQQKARLKVQVFGMAGRNRQAVKASVSACGATKESAGGLADFAQLDAGTHRVSVTAISAPDDQEFYAPPGQEVDVTLAAGDVKTIEVEVKPRNKITPKLKVEYKVVLFDRDLAQHQTTAGEPADKLLRPDPTAVEVSLTTSEQDPAYAGEGTLDAPHCDVFLDPACTQQLNRKLTNAELTARRGTMVYLRGTTRGLFTLTLTLDADANPGIKIEQPATESMGVVELQLEVYQHATPVAVAATTYPLVNRCADLENPNLIPA